MPTPESVVDLAGLHVVVTRPRGQEQTLCELIEAAGGVSLHYPVLEIEDSPQQAQLATQFQQLAGFDLIIFISPNAVARGMNIINAQGGLPEGLQTATVGRGSGRELKRILGRESDIVPTKQFNSEGLLALPAMQPMAGKRVMIVRGEGGRELLAQTLRERGAEVEYAEVYRRSRPEVDNSTLMHAWARNEIDIIVLTSGEGLRNLYDMVGQLGRQWLRKTPILVINERLVQLARELGIDQTPIIAAEASDNGIVAALGAWHRGKLLE
ncbi:MAG: uroporphyrinogen-III synthase [Gammaproteobacteria bacterium]|nr:uroporphyrinogen-III synthase [Gammaproteobacteria bacterium]